MTYKDAYEFGSQLLTECNVEEAKLDARLLLEYICETDRHDLLVHGSRQLLEEQLLQYEDLVKKRSQHIPLQHLTGIQEFMGLPFTVNEHVLVPRQDTECLVEELLIAVEDGMRVLDMCTGSGCILLSLMNYKNDIRGVGVDISQKALEIASINAKRLDINAIFLESSLFDAVDGVFDVICSNPPYIATNIIETLMPEVKEHEPLLALDGGEDGLDFYRLIARQAQPHLDKGGKIFFEIGYDQGVLVSEILQNEGYCNIKVKKDLAGMSRVVTGELWR